MRIEHKIYEITNKKNININIVHISDIHYTYKYKNKRLEIIKEKILTIKPNYICITGDLIDEYNITKEKEFEYFTNWLLELSKIAKVIISVGNHEYVKKENNKYIKNDDIKWLKKLKNNNLIVLDNEIYIENNITFLGFNPDYKYYKDKGNNPNKAITKINDLLNNEKSNYNILLLHTPLLITRNENYKNIKQLDKIDLILCGHTHGGMMPSFFPGNFGIISPERKLFPKKVRGKIKIKKTTMIISSGIIKLSRKSKITFLNDIYSSNINLINIIDKF